MPKIERCECGYQITRREMEEGRISTCPRCENPIILLFAPWEEVDRNWPFEKPKEAFSAGSLSLLTHQASDQLLPDHSGSEGNRE